VKWLLDTDTVIYCIKEMPAVVRRLEATRPADRYLSLITLGELFFGIFRSAQVEKNLRRYRRFIAGVKLLPFTPAVAERFGAIKADLARRGEIVADHDLWIAAHALAHGATVVTNNDRDFGRIAGLRLVNWTK
jgi:tRNA(fMet)-specific endonuclease VapC